ncbi:peptidylprolyl isomerase [Ruegeria sp. R14_0]|uniref:peptidylprolyl isomerase n=1 Tax=Ruegeria sp. R14_0 TaxID=2821100 RepID=UPI001ADB9F6F|nr:peptidylprolyl isomerase [Ruegeria sp. R14_0]MBO9446894.1 peptidyl-prolyl cis-trans isomerase [Ruegeria sp. R14_0]
MNESRQTTNPPRGAEPPRGKQSLFHRLATEPFVHFALLSLAIFGWFKLEQPTEWAAEPDTRVIVIDQRQVDVLAGQFEDTWRRPPTEDELSALREDWLKREVLVREAMALGLDGNDEIIRNRLVQKMNFLLASQAGAARPDDAVLQTYLADNADTFTIPARLAVSLVYLGQNPGTTFVEQTQARLAAGEDHRQLGQASLLPSDFGLSARNAVDGNFGTGFFDQVQPLPLGEWSGPVQSSFGFHLVRLDDRWDAVLPPFGAIRDRVLADWREKQVQSATQRFIDNLRSTYTVQDLTETGAPAGES